MNILEKDLKINIDAEVWSLENKEVTALKIGEFVFYREDTLPRTKRSRQLPTEKINEKLGVRLGTIDGTIIYDKPYNELLEKVMDGHWHDYEDGRMVLSNYYHNSPGNLKRTLSKYFKYAKDFYGFEQSGSKFKFNAKVLVINERNKTRDIPILDETGGG